MNKEKNLREKHRRHIQAKINKKKQQINTRFNNFIRKSHQISNKS